jgi:hypothetical protein
MKINIILFLFFLFFIFSCDQGSSSKIIVERRVYFDTINYGDIYHKAFILLNQTHDTIFIDKITHSCECIQVLNKDEIKYIPPKSKDSLIILLSAQQRGYISRSISVFLSEKQEPINLIIEGYVKAQIQDNR